MNWKHHLTVKTVDSPRSMWAWAGMVLISLWVRGLGAEILPPLGPYVHLSPEHFLESTSYSAEDRLVLTPYFYWYDSESGAHLWNSDGSDALTDHPPTLVGFSYRSVAWHKQQLRDMVAAGIDVVLPVFWGEPSQRVRDAPVISQPWSFSGLPPLLEAREELLTEGVAAPLVGMFYDTSTLQHNAAGERIDLTTSRGKQWFYETVRDFFSLMRPKHWAMIDGQPIVFLYSAGFASAHDQGCIDALQEAFAQDFGGRRPYVVREISWQVSSQNVYAWGGALGLKNPGVASLGPGYDHSAVLGREPLVVDRETGAFFERNWVRLLRRPSRLVMIETWNEYHEGTDIAESREYGRQYIELNRQYVELFRAGVRPPMPRGAYSDFKSVSVELESTNVEQGLTQVESADGRTEPAVVEGVSCRASEETAHLGRYLYFRIDDSFKWADTMSVDVEVEYYDATAGSFTVQFDGNDTNAPFQGAYTPAPRRVGLRGARAWNSTTIRLSDGRFLNSQNSGADFRLVVEAPEFYVRRVQVIRLGVPDEAGQTVHGFQQGFDAALNGVWAVDEPAPDSLRQAHGFLQLATDPSGVCRVLLELEHDNPADREILTRIRLSRAPSGPGSFGGVMLASGDGSGQDLLFELTQSVTGETGLRLSGDGLDEAPAQSWPWKANRWYWVRARHRLNDLPGGPDVMARLWPADGETLEPDAWQLTWDTYPGRQALTGPGGLSGPSPGAGCDLECDYFLLKSADLEPILVRLPALKASRPMLSAATDSQGSGFHIELRGTPQQIYWIERSTDLVSWSTFPAITDSVGRVDYFDSGSTSGINTVYRAWLSD